MTATAGIISASADRISDGQPADSQKVMSLGKNSEIPDLDNSKDVAIAVLEGVGTLTVCDANSHFKTGSICVCTRRHPAQSKSTNDPESVTN